MSSLGNHLLDSLKRRIVHDEFPHKQSHEPFITDMLYNFFSSTNSTSPASMKSILALVSILAT